jgi:transglutaminase-like putative cysteine protease
MPSVRSWSRRRGAWTVLALPVVLLAALVAWASPRVVGAEEPAAVAPATTVRWYETLRSGRKVGWTRVAWSASTFEGKPSLHDRTEAVTRTVRDMAGHRDLFETRTVLDIERDEDGTLWSQDIVVEEVGRRTVETLRWNGKAYLHSATVDGQEVTRVVPLDAPVSTDAEAFLSRRAKAGTLVVGEKLPLRELDLEGRRARVSEIEIVGSEQVEAESGMVEAFRVVLRHLETGSETTMWLDKDGAFVRSESDTGMVLRRVTEADALKLPTRPPSFSITVASRPPLERVMSADRLEIEVELADDPVRKLPDFPASPWSKAGAPRRDERRGWVIPATLTSYDHPEARAPLPIDPAGFERDLEPTALMPCRHPDLVATAERVLRGATDARTATERLARWVCDELSKESLEVAQGSALQILEERKGDCSEHALLFVALCRAAGIPARRCTGYVNIGPMWGAHAWAEVWTGRWIAADPTTGEIGGGARYLFFGYSDDPDSFPGVVSARIDGRIQIRALEVEEDGVAWPLDADDRNAVIEGAEPERWLVHPASGLEVRGLPGGWTATYEDGQLSVRGPRVHATLTAQADQGTVLRMGGPRRTFAGVAATGLNRGAGRGWLVHSRRRFVAIQVNGGDDEALALLERMLEPSVSERVTAPDGGAIDPGPKGEAFVGTWEADAAATLERQAAVLLRGLSGPVRDAMHARLEALVARVTASIVVRDDSGFRLEVEVPRGADAAERLEREGSWSPSRRLLDLGAVGETGRGRVLARLVAPDRLEIELLDWTLVLARR